MATTPTTTTTTTTTAPQTTSTSTPSFEEVTQLWQAGLQNSLQILAAQKQMDLEQQQVQFASQVETKRNTMLMAVINNIR